jgi:hypothetical protein
MILHSLEGKVKMTGISMASNWKSIIDYKLGLEIE